MFSQIYNPRPASVLPQQDKASRAGPLPALSPPMRVRHQSDTGCSGDYRD